MPIQKVTHGGNWGLDRIDQFILPLDGKFHYNRAGFNNNLNLPVDVVVIDSGIEYNNNEFENRAFPLYDFRTILPPTDARYISNTDPRFASDDYGTGTFMASIIGGKTYGVAKKCNLYGVKVYSKPIEFEKKYLLDAFGVIFSWHTSKSPFRPTVIYLPLSLDKNFDTDIENYLNLFYTHGCIIIVPSGNLGKNIDDVYPQNSVYTITTGPTTESDYFLNVAKEDRFVETLVGNSLITNYGNIDIYAPGDNIEGSWIKTIENNIIKSQIKNLSGSIVSGSFLAGYAALFFEDDFSKTQSDFVDFLDETSSKNIVKGINQNYKNLFLFNVFQEAVLTISTDEFLGEFEEKKDVEIILESFLRFGNPQDEKLSITLASGSSLFPNYYITEDGIIRGKSVSLSASLSGYVSVTASRYVGYIDSYFTILASSRNFQTTKTLWMRILDKNEPPVWKYMDDNISNFIIGSSAVYVSSFVSSNLNNSLFVEDIDNQNDLKFSILYGDLPKDIVLSSDGVLKGEVKVFSAHPEEFSAFSSLKKTHEFVLRVTDGYFYTDKKFVFPVIRKSSSNTAPFFENDSYPDILLETIQGESFSKKLVIKDADGDVPIVREVPVSSVSFSADVGFGLPSSLTLFEDGTITGSVDITVSTKKYVFGVEAFDGFDSNIENFAINVLPFDNQIINLKGSIFWETDTFLGELEELEESYFSVSAIGVSGLNIVYEVVSGYNLPPGLNLDFYSGEIYGKAGYVSSDQEFSFVLRARDATIPSINSEKEFIIKIIDRVSGNVCSFELLGHIDNRFKLSILEPEVTSNPVFKSISARYRIDKPGFDISIPKMNLLITSGIKLKSDIEVLSALSEDITSSAITGMDRYWRPLDLYVDDIVFFEARDFVGNIVYETVGLSLVDRLDNNRETTVSAKNPVVLSGGKSIIPVCVENMRRDLEFDIGYENQEILPKWLSSVQSTTNSIPGYKLFIPLMFVKGGFGNIVVKELKNIQDTFAPKGTKVSFNKLIYKKLIDPNNPDVFIIHLPVD